MKKRLSLIIAVLMVVGLFSPAFINAAERVVIEDPNKLEFPEPEFPQSDPKPEYDIDTEEVVTLKYYRGTPEYGVWKDTWYTDFLAEEFGIEIDLIPAGDGKVDTMIASGSLPDLIDDMSLEQLQNAGSSGMLLPLDDYLDQMPAIKENASQSLKYFRDVIDTPEDKAYAVATDIVTDVSAYGTPNFSPYLRYDLYVKLGEPEIKTLEDYITVLEDMIEIYPTNNEGQKVFAASSFPDWDQYWAQPANFINSLGAYHLGGGMLVMPREDNKLVPFVDSESKVIEALRFFNQLNQRGLFDPDSTTQKYDDWRKKNSAGRTLFSHLSWGALYENREEVAGFRSVYADDSLIVVPGLNPIGNVSNAARPKCISVGADTEHLDKVLAFIDSQYDYYYLRNYYNGPYGTLWEMDENNKPYITDLGFNIMSSPETEHNTGGELPGGTVVSDVFKVIKFGLTDACADPNDGSTLLYKGWTLTDYQREFDSELTQMWRENNNADNDLQYLSEHDQMVAQTFAPLEIVPDEIREAEIRVQDRTKQVTWLMIFAESDEEFDALEEQMRQDAMDLGYQEVIDWYTQAFANALDFADKYSD